MYSQEGRRVQKYKKTNWDARKERSRKNLELEQKTKRPMESSSDSDSPPLTSDPEEMETPPMKPLRKKRKKQPTKKRRVEPEGN